jgi:transcriptional regulator with XRE-family HTH domain
MASTRTQSGEGSVGSLIQQWRKTRQLSQLALATQAEISARHLCFVETGRAKPSREMVLLLSHALDVPLRERNALLLAAGFAPMYVESKLDGESLAPVRRALDAILRQQEPFPAVVMNRCWDILHTNRAAAHFFGILLGDRLSAAPTNVLRLMFHPDWLRPRVANWNAVAESLVRRVYREALGGTPDETTRQLLTEILGYPGVPPAVRQVDARAPLFPVVPVHFTQDGRPFNYFSTVTTLGTPQDITAQEIRIECFFPADPETERAAHLLRGPSGQ